MRSGARLQRLLGALGFTALLLLPPAASLMHAPFYIELVSRIMIFAIAALSLDLVLGYAGLVSFGHAGYLALGAYVVAILGFYDWNDGWLQLLATLVVVGGCATVVGAISLRTSGIHFIMITLAFGQLIYLLGTSVDVYGGEDGLNIASHSLFPGIDLNRPATLYYVILAVLLGFLLAGQRMMGSRFGMVLRGSKSNERRMAAIGFPVLRYRLVAYVASACACGIGGFLLANQNLFVSPSLAHWSRSAELMVMVILGGVGSLYGALLGAGAYLMLESGLSRVTEHWQLLLGPVLVLIVLYARRGLFGLLGGRSRA